MPEKIDLTNRRFGRFVVLSRTEHERHARWRCRCDCGSERIVWGADLTAGKSKSCGCLSRDRTRTHGMSKTAEYHIWQGIQNRCHKTTSRDYADYGAKGIIVCDRWRFGDGSLSGFECFFSDMGKRPTDRHSIDRFPNNAGHYEPGNCRWATYGEQNVNRRNTVYLEYRGTREPLAVLAKRFGIERTCLRDRLRSGWSAEAALETPVKRRPEVRHAAP